MKFRILIALSLLLNVSCDAQQKNRTELVSIDDTKVTLTENDGGYEMYAKFDPEKTDKIGKYMTKTIAKGSSTSFTNTTVDADMRLDNGAFFHVVLKPGKLELKLDKRKNSAEIYTRFKNMCEGIKTIIGENK